MEKWREATEMTSVYFYDWEKFSSVDELNQKLALHLEWSNNKTMRTLGRKSPIQLYKRHC